MFPLGVLDYGAATPENMFVRPQAMMFSNARSDVPAKLQITMMSSDPRSDVPEVDLTDR